MYGKYRNPKPIKAGGTVGSFVPLSTTGKTSKVQQMLRENQIPNAAATVGGYPSSSRAPGAGKGLAAGIGTLAGGTSGFGIGGGKAAATMGATRKKEEVCGTKPARGTFTCRAEQHAVCSHKRVFLCFHPCLCPLQFFPPCLGTILILILLPSSLYKGLARLPISQPLLSPSPSPSPSPYRSSQCCFAGRQGPLWLWGCGSRIRGRR